MKKANRFERMIVNYDIFGHAIGVHYRGSGAFKTRLGAFCTIVTKVLIIVNLVSLFIAFRDGSNQKEKTQVTTLDRFNDEP